MATRLGDLLRYTRLTAIVGDILKIRADDVGLGDMDLVEMTDGDNEEGAPDVRYRWKGQQAQQGASPCPSPKTN